MTLVERPSRRASSSRANCATTSKRPAAATALNADASAASTLSPSPVSNGLEPPSELRARSTAPFTASASKPPVTRAQVAG